jgi:hypothetical protein
MDWDLHTPTMRDLRLLPRRVRHRSERLAEIRLARPTAGGIRANRTSHDASRASRPNVGLGVPSRRGTGEGDDTPLTGDAAA